MYYPAFEPMLTRLQLAANILMFEEQASRGVWFAVEDVDLWESMLKETAR